MKWWMRGRTGTLLAVGGLGALMALLALSRAWGPEPRYQGRPAREWVQEALGLGAAKAKHVVCTQIRGQAVPYIVQELMSRHLAGP